MTGFVGQHLEDEKTAAWLARAMERSALSLSVSLRRPKAKVITSKLLSSMADTRRLPERIRYYPRTPDRSGGPDRRSACTS